MDQLPHLQLRRVDQQNGLKSGLPLCSDWERVGVKVASQILANLASGMYTCSQDLIDSFAVASEDLNLHFGSPGGADDENLCYFRERMVKDGVLYWAVTSYGSPVYVDITVSSEALDDLLLSLRLGDEFTVKPAIAALRDALDRALPADDDNAPPRLAVRSFSAATVDDRWALEAVARRAGVALDEQEMDQAEADAIADAIAAVESAGEIIPIELSPSSLLAMVGFIQLALGHPGTVEHPHWLTLFDFCVDAGARLEAIAPGAGKMVELGMPPLSPHVPTAPVMQSEYDMVFD